MYVHLYNDCHSLLRNPLFVRYFLQSTENSIESSIRTLFIYWPYAYSFLYNSMSLYLSKPMRYFFVIHSKLALYSIYNSYNVAYLFPVIFFAFFFNFLRILFDIVILLLILFYLAEFQSDLPLGFHCV